MRAAIALARRGLGRTWPNPNVGCVLVNDGRVVGRGWTQPGGRPHAETEALARAGDAARGATAYVTLEPCAHTGKTPPCAKALIAAGVARVVVALRDPDPRVDGKGLAMLRRAGIAVAENCEAEAAAEVVAGFLMRVGHGRPLFTWKVASTLDGRIATRSGDSQWITGPAARERGHHLRATHDAILVGAGTVAADDPLLTCRLPGLEDRQPLRLVLDGQCRLRPDSKLALSAQDSPVWVLTTARAAQRAAARKLREAGVRVCGLPDVDGHVDLAAAARYLGKHGLTRVLVEGGGGLTAALLREELVDRVCWFRNASLIGGDGIAALGPLGLGKVGHRPRLRALSSQPVGDDLLETFALAP
ncbi:MAG: bifunctional diaminohydroxyphosphoribosylaminopyrimidine deaminase/5-amino-6-(5-phosphoribosylamino)uracil reductase RibD [Alphaproteobacteria bacterium]